MKGVSIILIIIVIIFFAMTPIRISQGRPEPGAGRPLVVAHRGASGTAPENTLPAIDRALKAGADLIEIDVQLTADGQVVLMHDETVDRTTNGKGRVEEMTAEDIKKLDAGSWFGAEFAGTGVPLLGEALAHIGGRTGLLIEIKKKKGFNEGIEEAVIRIIREHEAASWCTVQSFNDEVLEIMHEKAPEIPLHKLIVFKYRWVPFVFDGKITRFSMEKYAYVRSINMHHRFFHQKFSRLVHDHGKMMFLWGCRKEESCYPADTEDYDGFMTDFPHRFRERQ